MMFSVELIYDPDCPNVRAARRQLLLAFKKADVAARWQEWDRTAPDSPDHVRGFGSPTILVGGQDVAETPLTSGAACRVYPDVGGKLSGVPPVDTIVSAMLESQVDRQPKLAASGEGGGFRSTLSVVPAIGSALLPGLTCPGCFPAYAAFLGSLGVGFVDYTPYLFPLTAFFLVVALAVFGHQARRSRKIGPLVLYAVGAVVLLVGKFAFSSEPISLAGIAFLISASLWNLILRRKNIHSSCPSCISSKKGGEKP